MPTGGGIRARLFDDAPRSFGIDRRVSQQGGKETQMRDSLLWNSHTQLCGEFFCNPSTEAEFTKLPR